MWHELGIIKPPLPHSNCSYANSFNSASLLQEYNGHTQTLSRLSRAYGSTSPVRLIRF